MSQLYSTTTMTIGLPLPSSGCPDRETGNAIDMLSNAVQYLDQMLTVQGDTGVANAYAVAPSPALSVVSGAHLFFKAAHANTGASTLAVNGGGAKAITKNGTTALAGAEISANQIVHVVYDGTEWQLISQ
jgi:hypothetical protein